MRKTKKEIFAERNAILIKMGESVPGFFTPRQTLYSKSKKMHEFLSARHIGGLSFASIKTMKEGMDKRVFKDIAEFDRFISSFNLVN